MCLLVAVYHEHGPYRPSPKPSEKLAAAFPYLCFILVVMGMSSAIYHETHAAPVVTDVTVFGGVVDHLYGVDPGTADHAWDIDVVRERQLQLMPSLEQNAAYNIGERFAHTLAGVLVGKW